MQTPKACFFDVFGTLVDWRSSIARETEKVLSPLGHSLDWLAFADAWRGEYQPAMEEIRSGRLAFCKLDILHRRNLERILPRFKIVEAGSSPPADFRPQQERHRSAADFPSSLFSR